MKSLSSIFPNASQDCHAVNPQLHPTPKGKNAVQTILKRYKAKPNHDQDTNNGSVSYSEPQHHETAALGATVQGKTKSIPRIRIRFTGYRVRPLDPDNFAGSCKDLLDGLRHSGIISGDEPWKIIFETEQEKVGSFVEEKTVIELEIP